MTDVVAEAIAKLHSAYESVREVDVALDQRWAGLLGPIMDLLANTADMIEEKDGA